MGAEVLDAMKPQVHRLTDQSVALPWLRGTARPPGPGFEEVRASLWQRLLVRILIYATVIACWCIVTLVAAECVSHVVWP